MFASNAAPTPQQPRCFRRYAPSTLGLSSPAINRTTNPVDEPSEVVGLIGSLDGFRDIIGNERQLLIEVDPETWTAA